MFLMDVKTKKLFSGHVERMESSGDIQEILINEDFLVPEESKIQLCFRGHNSSGIIEISKTELEKVYSDVMSRAGLAGKAQVIKFSNKESKVKSKKKTKSKKK